MVNGAGLAMATMDLTTCGGEPANFLDVGDSYADRVEKHLILNDNNVKQY